MQDNSKTGRSA